MAHLVPLMPHMPLGPIRLQMYTAQFGQMEELLSQNLIPEAAAHISAMGMLPYQMPMFYQVWFECILGRICIIAGRYDTGLKQLEYAKSLWEGPKGWKSGDHSIGGVKNKESHDRMIAENLERCKKGEFAFLPLFIFDKIESSAASDT
jgi:hypothetical protein